MDCVVIVGGGKDSLLVIEKVHQMSLGAVVVDVNPNAPGMSKADRTINASTHEHLPLLDELRTMRGQGVNIAAVVTRSSGIPVVTTARIAEALDLPGAGVRAASTLTKKLGVAGLCRESGIPGTDARAIEMNSARGLVEDRMPCVIKPNLGYVGKQGVTLVSDSSSIADAIRRAHEASVDGVVIVERYVPGVDLSLIAMVFDGCLSPCFALRELNSFDDRGNVVCKGFELLEEPDQHTKAALADISQKIVNAAGVRHSPFLLSGRASDDGSPVAVEVNLDFGGEQVLDMLLPSKTDFDFVTCFLESLISRQRPRIPITY